MTLADSGDRTQLPSGAVRDLAPGRGRFDLLSPYALEQLAILAEKGANKYAPRNWEQGFPLHLFLNSAMRHLNSLAAGRTDEDHAVAVMWNMMALIHTRRQIELGKLPASLANDDSVPVPTKTLDDFAFGLPPQPVCSECKEPPDTREIYPTRADHGQWMHKDCYQWTVDLKGIG
jgi:dATP/dGTP diphosphohydrolase